MTRKSALFLFVFVLGGCSFDVEQVPPPHELSLTLAELIKKYPDMKRVFKTGAQSEEMGMARIDPFLKAWGEPESKENSWWNLWPGNWPFIPQQLWTWNIQGVTIQCRIDHPIYEGSRQTICNCQRLNPASD